MISKALPQEKKIVYGIWKQVFAGDDGGYTDYFFRTLYKPENTLVLKESGNIVSTLMRICLLYTSVPVEILEQEGKVGGIVLKNVHDGQLMKLETKAVFPYIGADPCTEFAQDLGILDEHGYILVNNNMETTRAGIYGVGDVTAKTLRQVVTAANDGAIAAQQAFHQIKQ